MCRFMFMLVGFVFLPTMAFAQADCEPQPVDGPEQPVVDSLPVEQPTVPDAPSIESGRPEWEAPSAEAHVDHGAIPELLNGTFAPQARSPRVEDAAMMACACEDMDDWKGAAECYEGASMWREAAEAWAKLASDLESLGAWEDAVAASENRFRNEKKAALDAIRRLQQRINELEKALAAEEGTIRNIERQPLRDQNIDRLLEAQRKADELREGLAELKKKLEQAWKTYNALDKAAKDDRRRIEEGRTRAAEEARRRAEEARRAAEEAKRAAADAKKAAEARKAAEEARKAEQERRDREARAAAEAEERQAREYLSRIDLKALEARIRELRELLQVAERHGGHTAQELETVRQNIRELESLLEEARKAQCVQPR